MMAVYCNGKKALCFDYEKCSKECEFFDGSGWYEVETNGDRIRAMTDEELTEFILDKRENGTCFNNKCYYYDPNKGCDDCTLEWLKQPVR